MANLSDIQIGSVVKKRVAWNKGLTKETDERVKKTSETIKQQYRNGRINYNKGKKFSVEYRKNISDSHKGKSWGKHTDKWRKEQSRRLKGRIITWGDKISVIKKIQNKLEGNPNWLGGISFEPYGLEFNNNLKEKIREKFGRKCFECGYSEEKLGYGLSIHHIDFDKQNNNEDNLIPLCKSCHGQTQFNRNDWIDYFENKLNTITK